MISMNLRPDLAKLVPLLAEHLIAILTLNLTEDARRCLSKKCSRRFFLCCSRGALGEGSTRQTRTGIRSINTIVAGVATDCGSESGKPLCRHPPRRQSL